MRRSLSALVLGLSLVLASIAWGGFTFTRTVLDPGRSDELADQLLENPDLRGALVSVLADRIEAVLPEGVALPRQTLESVADRTLDDPAVQVLVRDGLVEVHQKALRGEDSDTTLHATALGTAARNVLIADRPELDRVVPSAPAMRVQLPTSGLSVLGRIRSQVQAASLAAAVIAAIGAGTALFVARDRSLVLRRTSNWAFGTAVTWLVVALGMPKLIALLAPAQGVVAGAVASVLFGAMIRPATILAVSGVGLLVGSWLWRSTDRRRGSRLIGRAHLVGTNS